MIYRNIELWRLLSVTYDEAVKKRLGYYGPCIGCRAYMHIAQIHVASLTKRKVLIYGEKPNNKKTKLKRDKIKDQMEPFIKQLEQNYGINSYSPMSQYVDIEDAINGCGGKWVFISEEPSCIFVKSNVDIDGTFFEWDVNKILYSFLVPVGTSIINLLNVNHKAQASDIKRCIVPALMECDRID
jgi:hypothetical protein